MSRGGRGGVQISVLLAVEPPGARLSPINESPVVPRCAFNYYYDINLCSPHYRPVIRLPSRVNGFVRSLSAGRLLRITFAFNNGDSTCVYLPLISFVALDHRVSIPRDVARERASKCVRRGALISTPTSRRTINSVAAYLPVR